MKELKKSNIIKLKDHSTKEKAANSDLISISIFTAITVILIFFESIYILIRGLSKGIIKKEILSEDSNLGFDLYIKMKS